MSRSTGAARSALTKIRDNSGPSTSSSPLIDCSAYPPSTKRRKGEDSYPVADETKAKALQVADHYSNRFNQSREERELSPIVHLKKLNNWIKSVLIQLYVHADDIVLDLACGKGGDLNKYDIAKVGYYVGVDIAAGSIEDARNRYNNKRQNLKFPARLICADAYEVSLTKVLADNGPFDVCSCQFALHYSWSTEERARKVLENVSSLLRPGGHFIGTIPDANVIVQKLRAAEGLQFGNDVYSISFGEEYTSKRFPSSNPFGIQYHFKLEDAVDCPEWLVPFDKLTSLAAEYGLEILFKKNFHEFVHQYTKEATFVELMWKFGALGDSENGISPSEWGAAYLYLAFVFRKVGQSKKRQRAPQQRWSFMKEEDILHLEQ